MCLSEFAPERDAIISSTSKEELATSKKQFKPFRDALKDLAKMSKSALERLQAVTKQAKEQ